MQPNEYVKNVLITESNNFDVIGSRFTITLGAENTESIRNIRLLHATMGICTEVGELFEFLDKNPLDLTNLKEEIGDAFWYCGIAIDELKLDMNSMVQQNRKEAVSLPNNSDDSVRIQFTNVLTEATKNSSILLDLLKKSAFYGKPLDVSKFEEVLGHFISSMMTALALGGFTVEEAMEVNIAKLRKRYGQKFTEVAAIHRNLDAERKILEGTTNI